MFLSWLTVFYCSGQVGWPSPLSTHIGIQLWTCCNSLLHRCQESRATLEKNNRKANKTTKPKTPCLHFARAHTHKHRDMKAGWLPDQVSASHCCPPWKQSGEGSRTDNMSCHSILQNQSLSQCGRAGAHIAPCCREKGMSWPAGCPQGPFLGERSEVWHWER